jgi:uncharacterized protein involved in type VI secretion and phage assembly
VNTGLLDLLADAVDRREARITGVVVGIVTNNKDDEGLGRVKVKFPWLSAAHESYWARIATPMAGKDRGLYFLPEVDDEVLVMFERGDVRFPFVIGAVWNGQAKAPADNADGKNNQRVIKSRSGHVIRLNDAAGAETIEIVDAGAGNSIVIDTAAGTVTVTAAKNVVLAAPNGELLLDAKKITLKAAESANVRGQTLTMQMDGRIVVQGSSIDLN